VNEYNADSDTLFTYLKLEQYVPRNVFFSVELTCSENMAGQSSLPSSLLCDSLTISPPPPPPPLRSAKLDDHETSWEGE
jgi:hypothetical protein